MFFIDFLFQLDFLFIAIKQANDGIFCYLPRIPSKTLDTIHEGANICQA